VEYARARHVVTEIQRTSDAVQALRDKDYRRLGQLMTDSHKSLRNDFEVTCVELEKLVSLARQEKDGVLGACMTGGGFGGCTVTLLRSHALASTKQRIEKSYQSREGEKATFYITTPCRGAGVVAQKFYLGKKASKPLFTVPTNDAKKPNPATFIPPGIDAIARITIGNEVCTKNIN
jgi:galactokinase